MAPMSREVSLTLPVPPSANRYWRFVVVRGRAAVLLSREARAYRKAVQDQFDAVHAICRVRPAPLEGPVAVTLTWFRGRKSGDLDNRIKQVLDALQGVAFVDDSQVAHIWALRKEDPSAPRVEVTVGSFAP